MEMKALTKEEIARQAPIVLATAPTAEVSDQYTFASTETIIDDLSTLGWLPSEVSQRKSRSKDTSFSPHMVKFFNPDLRISKNDGGIENVSYPQVIVKNRHDGLAKLTMMAGIFRLVCSNGMVIATAKFGEVKIAHRGYSFNEMREILNKRVEAIPEQIQVMNDMQSRVLDRTEQEELARQAIIIRSNVQAGTEEGLELLKRVDKVTLNELLTPVRKDDEGSNLWNTYQVVQEKISKGLFHMPMGPKAKVRQVREIKSFEKDLEFNKELFTVASSFLV